MTYGLIFGIFLFLAGIGAGWIVPRYPESWRVLPRERYAGLVIGIICVVWSLSMVSLLLEGSLAAYRPYLMYLGIGLVIGSFFYLEYLFTRALGGFILLMSNEVMHQAFVQHVPQRWFISICCYLLGLIGIFLITSPFRFRDLLKRLPTSSAWRYGTAIPLMIAGAATCILFLLARSA